MQREQYTPSDFFGDWTELKLQLQKNPRIKIAQDILDSTLRREKGLIDSPVVLTSVFTDPRFRILLNDEDNIKSLKHLDMLRRRMNISRASEMVSLHNTHNFSELSLLIEEKRMEQHMDLCNIEFFQIISNAPHLSNMSINPIEYWAYLEDKYLNLYRIICTVNAAAPTQVSVDRGFSSLSYILSSRRTSLSGRRLNSILLLRLNKELFLSDKVNPIK